MKYKTIDNTDLLVSEICLGTASFGGGVPEDVSFDILDQFCENGGNFLDTANVYGRWNAGHTNLSEITIGRWLASRKDHRNIIVATKAAHYAPESPSVPRVNREAIRRDLDESRRTLGLDTIDFLWLHRDDPTKPIGEIIEIMEELVKEGSIRWYGASNYTPERLTEAKTYASAHRLHGFSAVSNQWHPAVRNPQYPNKDDPTLVSALGRLDDYKELGLSFIPYNSTANGYFAKCADGTIRTERYRGLYDKYDTPETKAVLQKVLDKADGEHVSVQTALLRMMTEIEIPQVIPITTVSRTEQLNDVIMV